MVHGEIFLHVIRLNKNKAVNLSISIPKIFPCLSRITVGCFRSLKLDAFSNNPPGYRVTDAKIGVHEHFFEYLKRVDSSNFSKLTNPSLRYFT